MKIALVTTYPLKYLLIFKIRFGICLVYLWVNLSVSCQYKLNLTGWMTACEMKIAMNNAKLLKIAFGHSFELYV